MPVYHIVLFKLKPGVSKDTVAEWAKLGAQMVGKIPGLVEFHANPPLAQTANRAKGYDMGLVAILEKPEQVLTYGEHPAHQEYLPQNENYWRRINANRVHKLREQLCDDTLAYDFEF